MSRYHKQSKINQISGKTAIAKEQLKTRDSFTNLTARTGLGSGSIQDKSFMSFNFVSRNRVLMEAAYRSNWICGLAVDLVSNDMTRQGIEIKGEVDPGDIKILDRAINKLRLMDAWRDNIKWSRLYGGSIGILLIDGQSTEAPLNMDTIAKDQFKGMLVLDRWLIQPSLEDLVTEYGPEMGNPRYYTVLADAKALVNQRVHYSRVIRLEGVELPYWQRITENGWGQSVLERIWDRVVAFDSVTEGSAQLVYKAHLRVLKINGLKDLRALGGDKVNQGFFNYMEAVRQYQVNEGLTLLDSADEYIPHTYSFTGLSDMALMFGEQLSGGMQIPLVRLFGQSPAGMNSTGESDMATYYDNVSQQQESKMRPGMSKMLEALYRSVFGKAPPEDFDHDYHALKQMDDKEKSEVAASYAETILKAEENGIIDRATALKELRQLSHIIGIFSNITDEMITEAENEPPLPGEDELLDEYRSMIGGKKDESNQKKTKDSSDLAPGEKWITISGRHVKIDGEGNIVEGGKGMGIKNVNEAKGGSKVANKEKISLYHGSNGGEVKSIKSNGTVFNGLFTSGSRESAESHGSYLHEIKIHPDSIANNESLNEVPIKKLESVFSEVTGLSKKSKLWEEAWKAVIEDNHPNDKKIFESSYFQAGDIDDNGASSWEAQNLRGEVARRLGFEAVEMNDEHGKSYLVLSENPAITLVSKDDKKEVKFSEKYKSALETLSSGKGFKVKKDEYGMELSGKSLHRDIDGIYMNNKEMKEVAERNGLTSKSKNIDYFIAYIKEQAVKEKTKDSWFGRFFK